MPRVRLDSLLAERGLFESRSRAAAAVIAGEVHLGPGRRRAEKPGQLVDRRRRARRSTAPPPYVSRGGVKLANALDALGVAVAGRRCLDVGASTGGFTDCLLQRGAAHVVALDVAYGELALAAARGRARDGARARQRARARARRSCRTAPDLVVVDVSFISLREGAARRARAARRRAFDCLAMVKPQFEVGRERVGKGGVVRDPALRREALVDVAGARARARARPCCGFAPSGLPGPGGQPRDVRVARRGRPRRRARRTSTRRSRRSTRERRRRPCSPTGALPDTAGALRELIDRGARAPA